MGLYGDSGKENGNYYSIEFRDWGLGFGSLALERGFAKALLQQ